MSDYIKTQWVNETPPAITAERLNNLEIRTGHTHMTNDTAALMVIIELRQRVAALEAENADLRAALGEHQTSKGRPPPVPMPGVD